MQSQGDTTASGNNETGCVDDESRSQAVETTEKQQAHYI